jgi:hypothetical protein
MMYQKQKRLPVGRENLSKMDIIEIKIVNSFQVGEGNGKTGA